MSELSGPWALVVVGHGFAGLSAALSHLQEAERSGRTARVAVLERSAFEGRGGSTWWTTASLLLGADRTLKSSWAADVRANAGDRANEGYISAFYDSIPATLDWLADNGVGLDEGPNPLAEEGVGWNVSGGGRSLVLSFEQRIAELGGTFFYETTALRLERDDRGIAGLTVRGSAGQTVTMPTTTVVLACGGFEGNPEWLTRYLPNAYKLATVSPGTRNNKGDGIRMAVEIGAATAGQFDGAHIEPVDPRSDGVEPLVSNWFYGILVDQDGKRFLDEAGTTFDVQFDTVANTIFREDRTAYAINDASVKTLVPWMDYLTLSDQPAITADTIEELAVELGIDSSVLRSTVDEFNTAVRPDAVFDATKVLGDGASTAGLSPNKSNHAQPLTEGPFEAYPVGAQICFTYGGLAVDGATHVLDEDGRAIPGLHAAGEITGIFYKEYPAGTSGLRSMTFGRLAGMVTAAELAERTVEARV